MGTNQVYFLLGGNIGEVSTTLELAKNKISELIGTIKTSSSIYQTAAWGVPDQPDFLNQVIICSTSLSPSETLKRAMIIELSLGRQRHEKWNARTIDIDILFFGDQVIELDNLQIPHPEIPNRRFTLEPLAEIVPRYVHPVLQKTMSELLSETSDDLTVVKLL